MIFPDYFCQSSCVQPLPKIDSADFDRYLIRSNQKTLLAESSPFGHSEREDDKNFHILT